MLFETRNGWITQKDVSLIEVGPIRINIENGPLLPNTNNGYMYLDVKENGWKLYAFSSYASRNLFLQLIKISGVGCKTAANLCTLFDTNTLMNAIVKHDDCLLTQAPGVSKRIAMLIINQLASKLKVEDINDDGVISDILAVLLSLGLSNDKAMSLLQQYPNKDNLSLNEYLSYILKRIG